MSHDYDKAVFKLGWDAAVQECAKVAEDRARIWRAQPEHMQKASEAEAIAREILNLSK